MINEFHPPARILMGPGPSNADPRVLLAMAKPMIGFMDPQFFQIMNNLQELLRLAFGTKNALTIALPASGMAGMEAAFVNVVEPGDRVLVCINGFFGERMADIAERCGANLKTLSIPWGQAFDLAVNAETSTGVLQPLEEFSKMLKKYPGALLLVDTVTSLGGHPVKVDEWGIDICYSGTQKCLGCPPGLAPITFSEKAMERIKGRSKKVQSFYLDMTIAGKYWGTERGYHATAPISMDYALLEALRIVEQEGLERRYERHRRNHLALVRGIEAMGLSMLVKEPYRLWSLNTVNIPQGIDDAKLRKTLLDEYNLEIGGALGSLKGKVWRVGLMGYSSSEPNVLYFLTALEQGLREQGFEVPKGVGTTAAKEFYSKGR
ncbi:MAG: alanine--glyoxylate aminotransferase family protein [Deltaproteobacteria bacterium]|nr:alanine--glyoxylate aminotransferase family protein [Deltaproteobacteria bacterium]